MSYNSRYSDPYRDHVRNRDSVTDLEYFQSKFDCRIEDSREYNQYVRTQPYYRDFCDYHDLNSYKMENKVVPMKAIHISPENLARLMAEQEHMDRLTDDANFGKQQWRQSRADAEVRAANPAVEKAYRNYQMLLELTRK